MENSNKCNASGHVWMQQEEAIYITNTGWDCKNPILYSLFKNKDYEVEIVEKMDDTPTSQNIVLL